MFHFNLVHADAGSGVKSRDEKKEDLPARDSRIRLDPEWVRT